MLRGPDIVALGGLPGPRAPFLACLEEMGRGPGSMKITMKTIKITPQMAELGCSGLPYGFFQVSFTCERALGACAPEHGQKKTTSKTALQMAELRPKWHKFPSSIIYPDRPHLYLGRICKHFVTLKDRPGWREAQRTPGPTSKTGSHFHWHFWGQ